MVSISIFLTMFGWSLGSILCVGLVIAQFGEDIEYDDLTVVDEDDLASILEDSPQQKQLLLIKRGYKSKS